MGGNSRLRERLPPWYNRLNIVCRLHYIHAYKLSQLGTENLPRRATADVPILRRNLLAVTPCQAGTRSACHTHGHLGHAPVRVHEYACR